MREVMLISRMLMHYFRDSVVHGERGPKTEINVFEELKNLITELDDGKGQVSNEKFLDHLESKTRPGRPRRDK
jgi:hypothetical protein